ncbi:MAG: dihydroneopterin aldolase [Rhodospirillales bacterium]|nr:dihydroneopterin aldolase [Rhodospirillales bacterium]
MPAKSSPLAVSSRGARPLRLADARRGLRHVFIRDLVVETTIGVHRRERRAPQRVRINLDLAVTEGEAPLGDELANVVCYEAIADQVRAIAAADRLKLVETLAETIAQICLKDRRVRSARVRIEKLDIFPDATSAGVEIERFAS